MATQEGTVPVLSLAGVRLGILSAADVRALSVCEITQSTLMNTHGPVTFALNDPRLGVVSRKHLCPTCLNDVITCPGHCGHIELQLPVVNVNFEEHMLHVLQCVCWLCSGLLVRDNVTPPEHAVGMKLLDFMQKHIAHLKGLKGAKGAGDAPGDADAGADAGGEVAAAGGEVAAAGGSDANASGAAETQSVASRFAVSCPCCGVVQPTYNVALGKPIWHKRELAELDDNERALASALFTPRVAQQILRGISDADARALGFEPPHSHPASFVMDALLVPPPIIRPSVSAQDGGKKRGQNDLTTRQREVVKVAARVRAITRERPLTLAEYTRANTDLYVAVNSYINSEKGRVNRAAGATSKHAQSSSSTGRSLCARLRGKEGSTIRQMGCAKRDDHTARTVIIPGSTLDPDEFGLPRQIANTLTIPVRVTALNCHELEACVRRGPRVDNGAAAIATDCGRTVHLGMSPEARARIELETGWIVHRHLRNRDIGVLNRQPTLHQGSMMAHFARIVDTLAMQMPGCDCKPYNADFDGDEMNLHIPQGPLMQAEAEGLLGVEHHQISASKNRLQVAPIQAVLIGAYMLSLETCVLSCEHASALWMCMRHAYRELGPPTLRGRRYTGRDVLACMLPADLCLDAGSVRIRGGRIVSGHLCRRTAGAGVGGIPHALVMDYGARAGIWYSGDMQRVGDEHVCINGFSVGVDDCVPGHGVAGHLDGIRGAMRVKLREIYDVALRDGVDADRSVIEGAVQRVCGSALRVTGAVVLDGMRADNAVRVMTDTVGSKGSPMNPAQISGMLGQQTLGGARILPKGGRRRVFSHFEPGSRDPDAYGFVSSSYGTGLGPHELFFHAIGGREGLTDTAVKTSRSGYIQRRMMKMMEDKTVHVGQQVRLFGTGGAIVQFLYGGDGMDGTRVEPVKCDRDLLTCRDAELRARLVHAGDAESAEIEWREIRTLRDTMRVSCISADRTRLGLEITVPLNVRRALLAIAGGPAPHADATDARAVVRRIDDAIGAGACHFRWHVREHLSSALVAGGRMSRAPLLALPERVASAYRRARAHVGMPCGAIAAQCMGEPATQLTLNSFHSAGVGCSMVATGMPRLDEIMQVSQKPRSTATLVPFDVDTPAVMRETVRRAVAHTSLADVATRVDSVVIRADEPAHRVLLAGATCPSQDALGHLRRGDPLDLVCARVCLDVAALRDLVGVADAAGAARAAMRAIIAHVGCASVSCAPVAGDDPAEAALLVHWCRASDVYSKALATKKYASVRLSGVDTGAVSRTLLTKALKKIVFGGVRGIRTAITLTATAHVSGPGGSIAPREVTTLACEGANMADVMRQPGVDWTRATCSHVHEVIAVLGLEAACAMLHREIMSVLGVDGSRIDQRHVSTLVNSMTHMGYVMPANRHGIMPARTVGTIATATFEQAPDVFCDAAASGDLDGVREVSSCIMTGQPIRVGTGMFHVRGTHDFVAGGDVDDDDDVVVSSAPAASGTPGARLTDRVMFACSSTAAETRWRPATPSNPEHWLHCA